MKAVKVSEHEVRVGRKFFSTEDWKAVCDSADSIVTDIVMGGCVCGCDWKVCDMEEFINDESKDHCRGLIDAHGFHGFRKLNIDWVDIADQVFQCLNSQQPEGK